MISDDATTLRTTYARNSLYLDPAVQHSVGWQYRGGEAMLMTTGREAEAPMIEEHTVRPSLMS
jgi:hypothetical protein